MKKNKKILYLVMFIGLVLVVNIPSGTAEEEEDEFELFINEYDRTDILWEFTQVNKTLISELVNDSRCDKDLLKIKKGDELEWTLCYGEYYEYSPSYWELEVEITYYTGKDEDLLTRLYKDPKNLAEKWTSRLFEKPFKNVIPINVEDYLKSFKEELIYSKSPFYQVNGDSIHEDLRNGTYHEHRLFIYNPDGILEVFILYYDNITALRMELMDYYVWEGHLCGCDDPFGPLFYLALFILATLTACCIFLAIIYKEKVSRRKKLIDKLDSLRITYVIKQKVLQITQDKIKSGGN